MNTIVVVNQVDALGSRQTTTLLMGALLEAGHDVWLTDVDAFPNQDSPSATYLQIDAIPLTPNMRKTDTETVIAAARQTPRRNHRIESGDLVLIRTNPGRDIARQELHGQFLQSAVSLHSRGIRVINSPRHLTRMANKATLRELDPDYVPRSLVSDDETEIIDFIQRVNGPSVVKPLVGSRGQDVICVSPDQYALEAVIREAVARRAVIVQEFVVADQPGDIRVVCVGGHILERNGHVAAIRRTPAAGDFRANLHTGGVAHPVQLTSATTAAANHAAQFLNSHGVWMAGIDIVGDKIIELNVFSTGGLYDAQRFSQQNFCAEIVARLDSLST